METTKHALSPYATLFFERLKKYLDTKLYYFGSVQRDDYFECSDIDVAIFSENIDSTINQMQNFLELKREKFKKFVWRINSSHKLITGYKLQIKDPKNKFRAEFSIFDEKYKNKILAEYNSKKVLPFYATWLLIIVKFFYYTLEIIPRSLFGTIKNYILTDVIGKKETDFVIVDIKNKEH